MYLMAYTADVKNLNFFEKNGDEAVDHKMNL